MSQPQFCPANLTMARSIEHTGQLHYHSVVASSLCVVQCSYWGTDLIATQTDLVNTLGGNEMTSQTVMGETYWEDGS